MAILGSGPGGTKFTAIELSNARNNFNEGVCGMIFDIGLRRKMLNGASVFENYPTMDVNFGDGQTICINSLEEAMLYGLTSDMLNGIPYYHIKSFYDYIGNSSTKTLYVSFRALEDMSGAPSADAWLTAFEDMQMEADGKVFQIGIWTEMPILDESYRINTWLAYVKGAIDNINGNTARLMDSISPINAILFPCVMAKDNVTEIDYRRMPNMVELNIPHLSIVLGQDSSAEVHVMQDQNINHAPVSYMGFVMACLSLAYAEESIGFVQKFNLNKQDNLRQPELGFGLKRTPIETIPTVRYQVLSSKGFILPISYPAIETGIFLSNDQTLTNGDYRFIARGRIIHKCRRIVQGAMIPYVNEHHYINPTTGTLSVASISIIQNDIVDMLDTYMVNADGQEQIIGRSVRIEDSRRLLENDELEVHVSIVPLETAIEIDVTDYYTITD